MCGLDAFCATWHLLEKLGRAWKLELFEISKYCHARRCQATLVCLQFCERLADGYFSPSDSTTLYFF